MATVLAFLAAICFGTAIVTSKFGLEGLDARSGAAIAIPTSTVALLIVSPFALDASGFTLHAVAVFAIVGFFYPALVAILRFVSTDRLGPAITSTILASTSPLFAVVGAAAWLNEVIPSRAILATCGVVCGIFLVSFKTIGSQVAWRAWWLIFPITAAVVSGFAQVFTKSGLFLWPNPFAAALISYIVSSFTVFAVEVVRKQKWNYQSVRAVMWFGGTGILNGIGVLTMFSALNSAPVSLIAPIVATYPLVTLFLGAAVLRNAKINLRMVAGAVLTVTSIAYLLQ